MEKLTLGNPITINGKKVKTLTYDTGAITVGMFAEAEALKLRATTHKAGGSAGATELDYSMHLYLAMMAITAVNPDIDIADLERISGPDVMELVRTAEILPQRGRGHPPSKTTRRARPRLLPSLPHLSRRAPTGTPDRLPARILRSGRGGEKAEGQDPEAEDPTHPAA